MWPDEASRLDVRAALSVMVCKNPFSHKKQRIHSARRIHPNHGCAATRIPNPMSQLKYASDEINTIVINAAAKAVRLTWASCSEVSSPGTEFVVLVMKR